MGKTQFTRITSRWEGYYAEDVQCKFCLHYSGYKKRGCTLASCLYEGEKTDALEHGRVKRERRMTRWDL